MNILKNKIFRIIAIVFVLLIASIFIIRSCTNKKIKIEEELKAETALFNFERDYKDKKVTVVYFSCTGNTEKVAAKIATIFNCDYIPIEPEVPYTEIDITSNDESTRPMQEKLIDPFDENNVTPLPKIKPMNMKKYDVIFLGYPIWYNDAPKVLYSFVKDTDLHGKTIVPFCTADNSDIGASGGNLANFSADDVYFMGGKKFSVDTPVEDIKVWVTMLGADLDVWFK